MKLSDPLTELKGVGPKKAEQLKSSGLETIEDLALRFPKGYEDRRVVMPAGSLEPGKEALIEVRLLSRRFRGYTYRKKSPLLLYAEDDTGRIEIVYFNGSYLANLFNIGSVYTFYGKVTENNGRLQMVHPEFHRAGDPDDVRAVIPVYPAVTGISQKEFRKLETQIRPLYQDMKEWLPEWIPKKYHLADPAYAYENIHFPNEGRQVLEGRYRLIFEDLLILETGLLYMRRRSASESGIRIDPTAGDEFIEALPFDFTEGQKDAWADIRSDLDSEKIMNRLIQGDVGSGKTALAEAAMAAAAGSGYQAAMMAPTEILAKQHYQNVKQDMEPLGFRTGLLCGSMKPAEKQDVLEQLEQGDIDILIGTHSLIQPDVRFRNLGLVVTDEQHRFGVYQRKILSEKGKGPNVMVMTATPIPRTLAVILYGDLDISSIHTMPEGRKPVKTYRALPGDRDRVYEFVRRKIEEGRQCYVVAPLIEESDKIDARSANELYDELRSRFPDYRVALLHGGMDQEEKDSVMNAFAEGKIDILVSTVVIEIGINVRNATIMVIENCERFGLAQMHQLRGRVGRGSEQSFCFLILNNHSEVAEKRVTMLCESTDGFRIAEEDLKLRGPGEIFGTRQHGLPEMQFSEIVSHQDVLEKAKKAAEELLDRDPALAQAENAALRKRIEKMFGSEIRLEL